MTTLSNLNVLDGECSGRPRSENGDIAASPKYKKRKVFAVRDFPPGCGRLPAQLISTVVIEADCAETFEGVVPSGFNPGADVDEAGPGVEKIIVTSDQAQVSKSINVEHSGMPSSDALVDSKDEEFVGSAPPLEHQPGANVDEASPGAEKIIVTSDQAQDSKSINVEHSGVPSSDALVDFKDEEFVGSAPSLEHQPGADVDEAGPGIEKITVTSDLAQVSKSINVEHSGMPSSDALVGFKDEEFIGSALPLEHHPGADVDEAGPGVDKIIVSPDQEQVAKSVNVEHLGMPSLGAPVDFKNDEFVGSAPPLKRQPVADVDEAGPGVDKLIVPSDQAQVSKSINVEHLGMPSSDEPVDLKDEEFVGSAPPLEHQPAVELSNCPSKTLLTYSHEKTGIRKYPPRRKVSAVRDFPPFCGRNAPLRDVGSTEVAAYTESKSLVLDKSGLENELTQGTGTYSVQVQDGGAQPLSVESGSTHVTCEVQTEVDDPGSQGNKTQDESEASSDNVIKRSQEGSQLQVGSLLEDIQQKYGLNTDEDRQSCSSYSLPPNQYHHNDAAEFMEEKSIKSLPFVSECKTHASREDLACLNIKPNKAVIVGPRAVGNNTGRKVRADHEPKSIVCGIAAIKERRNELSQKHDGKALDGAGKVEGNNSLARDRLNSTPRKKKLAVSVGESSVRRTSSHSGKACQGNEKMAVVRKDDYQEHVGADDDYLLVRRTTNSVNLPPHPAGLVGKADENDAVASRRKVRETLRLFHAICRKLLQAKESKQENAPKRIDLHAANMLKGKNINPEKIIGSVPGVEVGDEFQYRIELNIIGLHRQTQAGIDYVKKGKKILCTSIVASGGYDDNMDDSDVLVYTGQGGNANGGDKQPEDQTLVKGNLALKNSADEKNPVRVIRGDTKVSDDEKAKRYIYDGLYDVEKWWQEMAPHGKLVFKFKLVRRPGQAPLAWKLVKKSKKFKMREGLCAEDISKGKEVIPICAVNTVDDEKPPVFQYITHVIYPDCVDLIPPVGCDCSDGCKDYRKCTCVAKNGGEIPYNHNGAIVEAKSLVYECGPSCKCPPSCHNRVSQNGIRFQLEIFKTESRGWGVRSLNSIPSGSFICEYIGELLEDKEAEQRTGNDEYLFDIGNEYDGAALHNELSSLMPTKHAGSHEVVEDGSSFTIDAAQYGNIGRFINHSCSPNLYAQNVVYDHVDKRIPHIMLFAAETIPPLQELTYHYNYAIDQVRDSDGNIKRKNCYCGSAECTGRMY